MNSLTPSGEDAARAAEAKENGPKDGPTPTRNSRDGKRGQCSDRYPSDETKQWRKTRSADRSVS